MIEVRYNIKECWLEVKGHAGCAPEGHDIVCAGASTLAFTLAESLIGMRQYMNCCTEYMFKKGDAYIRYYPIETERHFPDIVFTSILKGFEILAKNYPNNIKILGSGLEMF